jgi:protein-S-isoprenylcysteine O-methyltransferase Ste14
MSRVPTLGPRGEGWVALQFLLIGLIAVADTIAPGRIEVLGGPIAWTAGAALILLAVAIAIRGYLDLSASRAFTAFPYPLPDASLVQTGVYGVIRHPLYAALIAGGLGLSLMRASPSTFLATVGLFVVLDLKRHREEAWLAARFPGYDAYRGRTRALIPFLY